MHTCHISHASASNDIGVRPPVALAQTIQQVVTSQRGLPPTAEHYGRQRPNVIPVTPAAHAWLHAALSACLHGSPDACMRRCTQAFLARMRRTLVLKRMRGVGHAPHAPSSLPLVCVSHAHTHTTPHLHTMHTTPQSSQHHLPSSTRRTSPTAQSSPLAASSLLHYLVCWPTEIYRDIPRSTVASSRCSIFSLSHLLTVASWPPWTRRREPSALKGSSRYPMALA